VTRTLARVFLPCPKLCSRLYPLVFRTLKVSFSIPAFAGTSLPPCASAGGQFGDGAGRDREIRDEAVVIGSLTLGIEGLDGEPVDGDGIAGGAQRHGVEPAVDGGGAFAAFADGLAMFLQFSAVEILGDGFMRRRLAGENEVATGIVDGGDDRLTGKQIVTEIDRPKVRDCGTVLGQPALSGVAFAILLLRPVLWRNEFGRQRQDLLVTWGDYAGTKEGVEVFGAAIGAPPRRALRAFDLSRAVVLSPVQRDQ
jgi:hypothetical protein